MKNKRLRNILAAGALTGLVLATLIAFGLRNRPGEATAAEATPQTVTTGADQGTTAGEGSLQAENEQLRSALQTMQEREQQYQAQIEAANRTILQLQDDPNGSALYAADDDDRYEVDDRYEEEHEGEHEQEEHEGEHEEYEEHDDD